MDKNPPLYGMYRAKVVDNKDPEKFGRVVVWIPDIMPLVDENKGLYARPANNPVGGRNMEEDNEHHYMGSSYIPKIGSWVFVFFECGNPNRPYYFGALDLENTPVLPENQLGSNYEDKWTVLKTHEGRCIIISDDPDDERVEITGKKRQISNAPTGDTNSVYTIDGNMSTILVDEREGKEKILIRTVKGDFFHIDIDEQKLQVYFKDDITIQTDKNIFIDAAEDINVTAGGSTITLDCATDINLKATSNINEYAGQKMNLKATVDINEQAGANINMKSGAITNSQSGAATNIKAGATVNIDGSIVNEQCGAAGPAGPAEKAIKGEKSPPEGERDT